MNDQAPELDLFAGVRVSDYAAARPWYERLFGSEPAFEPHETECVWELAEHRYAYIVEAPEGGGGGVLTLFVGDLDRVVDGIAARGIGPDEQETYPGKARKVVYRDADGNEIGFAGSD